MAKDVINLSQGAGGELMNNLIMDVIVKNIDLKKALNGVGLDALDDGASIRLGEYEVVTSMDGHVVDPIFFPGGDIGKLAVAGTTNDIAMMGARPVALLDAIIVEEGFLKDNLNRIIQSMNSTAKEIGVAIIGGDFKVMPHGRLDKIVIATCGIGLVKKGHIVLDSGAKPGDKVIITNYIGDHGITLLAHREGLSFSAKLKSDVAPIWSTIKAALDVGGITAMKDPTRGGVASALNEIAHMSKASIWIDEEKLQIRESVRAASEMLGLNTLEITCEGTAIICVNPSKAEEMLRLIKETKYGKNAQIVGTVKAEKQGYVFLKTMIGGTKIIDMPMGEPIPRVC